MWRLRLTFGLILVSVLAVTSSMAAMPQTQSSNDKNDVAAHLQSFWKAIQIYDGMQVRSPRMPATLEDLKPYFDSPSAFEEAMTHPITHERPGFVYVKPAARGLQFIENVATTPLVLEARHGKPDAAGAALYADGEIRRPVTAVSDKMKAILAAIERYARQNAGHLPDGQAEIEAFLADRGNTDSARTAFNNPRTGWNPGFWYCKPGAMLQDVKDSSHTAVLFESHGGPLIGFLDGRVVEADGKSATRSSEANMLDLRDAMNLYSTQHSAQFPDRLEQLRSYFPDEAAWKRATTQPKSGESPGYTVVNLHLKIFDQAALAKTAIVYELKQGKPDAGGLILYGDLHLLKPQVK
jgi:hypothetical protein